MPRAPQKCFVQPGILLGLQRKRLLRRPQDQQTARSENGRQHHDLCRLKIALDGRLPVAAAGGPISANPAQTRTSQFFQWVAIWRTTVDEDGHYCFNDTLMEYSGILGADLPPRLG